MTRLLAIICVFLIVIGLYSAWRYPRSERTDPDPVAGTVASETETVETEDEVAADATDPVTPRGPKERSLDR